MIFDLGSGACADTATAGGKALGLERLMALGLPCPPAYCVTTAALDLYLDETGLRERLTALLAAPPDEGVRAALQLLAYEEELPAPLADALLAATERLRARAPGVRLVAVRSSATDEDGDRHSFAGLHETQLGTPLGGIPGALRRCWASLWSEGSIAYRTEHDLPLAEASMAVVVQVLVPADASAVVFTANPMTGSRDEVVVQSTCGLGAPLVDSEITPDTAVVAKADLSIVDLRPGDKQLRVDARADGGLLRTRVDGDEPALDEAQVRALAELAIAVEAGIGMPVDVEAALSGGAWQLIQARPITAVATA